MKRLQEEMGFVSVLILLVIAFLSWQGFLVFTQVDANTRMVQYEAQRIKTAYAADAGLEYAKGFLRQDPFWKGGMMSFAGGAVDIVVVRKDAGYRITSRAQIGNTVQKRFAEYEGGEQDNLILNDYGELYD